MLAKAMEFEYTGDMPVYTARGRLSQGRIVELETPLPLESAEVEGVITVVQPASPYHWRESLQQIWESLEGVGHTAPDAAEVVRTLRELRADRCIRDENIF